MTATILACFAHPDDEVFGTGGTFLHYAAQGATIHLVCATRGDVGEVSDPSLATAQTIAQVRTEELRCSARTLGIQEPIHLDYRDSGMAGTPENEDPRAFINAPADGGGGAIGGDHAPSQAGRGDHLRSQGRLRPPGSHRHPPAHDGRGARRRGRVPIPRSWADVAAGAALLSSLVPKSV